MPGSLRSAALPLLLALVAAASGCAVRADDHAGVTVEREEIRSGHRIVLKSAVSPRRATLGDPVEWTLSAELPESATPGKLLRDRDAAELDVRAPKEPGRAPAAKDPSRSEGRELWTWPYRVRGFALGKVALPAVRLPVAFGSRRDTLLFPADTLAIDSLTSAATGAVLPDRGPILPELRPVDYAVAGLLALVALAAIALLIASLRARGEPLPRDEFYDRLSLALRDYAAAATGTTTRDRTTLEIVRELREREEAPPDGVDALRRALARADLAKFARRGGGWDEAVEALDLAERLPEKLPARTRTPEPSVNAEDAASSARTGGR